MTFEQIKDEMTKILQKAADEEKAQVKKALQKFDSAVMAKGRPAGIGEEHVWKGKRYRKMAPGKWRRVYDKADRGARRSINIALKRVKNAKSLEDLMMISMTWKSRFKDSAGVDLPILDELRKALDEKNAAMSAEKKPLPVPPVTQADKKTAFSSIKKQIDKRPQGVSVPKFCEQHISFLDDKIADYERMPYDAKARKMQAVAEFARGVWKGVLKTAA